MRDSEWTKLMFEAFQESIEGVILNGHPEKRLAHNLNVCFPGIESKALMHLLRHDIAVSAGSACTTMSVEPSHVLKAIGLSDREIYSAVRFGLGRQNNEEEIKHCINKVISSAKRLRKFNT